MDGCPVSRVERILALDIDDIDQTRTRLWAAHADSQRSGPQARLGRGSARLLPLLLVGRTSGPCSSPTARPVRPPRAATGAR